MTWSGMLRVHKPSGCTSHDVVAAVRRALRQKKVGHCGTLDPMATGLLLVTTGRATRLSRFLIGAPKEYEGEATFGRTTETYDAQGTVTAESPTDGLTEEPILEALSGFVGTYEQVAPAYSAKKVKGRKMYELARSGEPVPERRSEVQVYGFDAVGPLEGDRVAFRLSCASGTYARSLVHDLGQRVGTGAHLSALKRTKIGPFDLEGAISLDELDDWAAVESLDSEQVLAHDAWIGFDEIPLPFATHATDPRGADRIRHGQTVLAQQFAAEVGDWVRVTDPRGGLLAIGVVSDSVAQGVTSVIQPKIVFN